MQTREVIFSRTALKDLDAIWDHLAVAAILQLASAMSDLILRDIAALADFPGMGHQRAEVRDERYRFWSIKSYVIAYRFTRNRLYIARVVHGARDFRRIFDARK